MGRNTRRTARPVAGMMAAIPTGGALRRARFGDFEAVGRRPPEPTKVSQLRSESLSVQGGRAALPQIAHCNVST